jgi:hypothetical protein
MPKLALDYKAQLIARKCAPAGGRPTAVCPINPLDAKPDRSTQRNWIVDQLYEELMRSSGCLLASKNASIFSWLPAITWVSSFPPNGVMAR